MAFIWNPCHSSSILHCEMGNAAINFAKPTKTLVLVAFCFDHRYTSKKSLNCFGGRKHFSILVCINRREKTKIFWKVVGLTVYLLNVILTTDRRESNRWTNTNFKFDVKITAHLMRIYITIRCGHNLILCFDRKLVKISPKIPIEVVSIKSHEWTPLQMCYSAQSSRN